MASSIGVLEVAPITGGHLTPFLRSKLAPEYIKMYDESSAGKPQVQERPPRTFRM